MHQSETSTGIYYLDTDNTPVLYHSIQGEQLPVSDPCGPSGDLYWTQWNGLFAFDEDDNLYVSPGNRVPAGIYTVGVAGPGGASGNIEKLMKLKTQITALACYNGIVYFRDGEGNSRTYALDAGTSEVTSAALLPVQNLTG